MKKKILLLVASALLFISAGAQTVTIDIEESSGGCGQSSDCDANIACFDLLITIDQPNWVLSSYNVWTQYPAPPVMSYHSDHACITQEGGDTDDNPNGQYRVAGIDGVTELEQNTPTIFHSVCYDYSDETEIRDSIVASGGTLLIYGSPFYTTVTLVNEVTGLTAGLTIPQQEFLTLDGSTFTCLVPDLTIVKELTGNADNDNSGNISLGDVLTYTITATNSGYTPQENVVVSDPMLTPGSTTCVTLDPGENCILTGTYTVTQDDVDAGEIVNTATVVSDNAGPVTDELITPVPNEPDIAIEKSLLTDISGGVEVGDVLSYKVEVENTGTMTLNNVVVSDPKLTPSSTTCSQVAPGASCILSGLYIVKQADMNAGQIINTATGNSDETPEVTDEITTILPQNPDIETNKEMITDISGGVHVGDILVYHVEVANVGNVTLHNVTVSDPMLTPNFKTCATVNPGNGCSLIGTYIVKQSDIDAGQILNTATGDSDETGPEDGQVTVPIEQNPEITTVKTLLTDISGGVEVGDILTYQVEVTNTGNITLHNVNVTDDKLTPGSTSCAVLAPGEMCTLTGTYAVQQSDKDAGEIVNTGIGDSDETDPVPDEITTTLPQIPGMETEKTLLTDISGGVNVGDELTYQVEVYNSGDVTLNNVVISDDKLTPDEATYASLAPGESAALTGIYTVTQADKDAGVIMNTGIGDSDETDPVPDEIETPLDQNPDLQTVKSLETDISSGVMPGDVLTYEVVVTNTGDITLNNVVVNDPMISPNTSGCTTLAPGENCILSGTYTVTQADIQSGQLVNTGTGDSDETPPDTDELITPLDQVYMMDIDKQLLTDVSGGLAVGDILTYQVDVSNTGNMILNNVVVSDAMLTPATSSCATLAPGATCTLSGTYTVTQADMDAGEIVNTATGDSDETGPVDDQLSTPIPNQNPELSVVKTLLTDISAGVFDGDELTYEVVVTNTGNITLTNVLVEDSKITPSSASCGVVAPGESCTLTGTLTVTQADIENGLILNTGSGTSDQAGPVTDELITPLEQLPAISTTKILLTDISGGLFPGDEITYSVEVQNTGNLILTNVTVTDTKITPGSTGCAVLNPGEVCTLTGTYTITQNDIDATQIVNTGTGDSDQTGPDSDELITPVFSGPLIDAVDDAGVSVNGMDGGTSVANVLANDLLGVDPVNPAEITLQQISSTNPNVTLNILTGEVNVAPGTPAGNYELVYEICEIANPTNCDQAMATVPVTAAEIIANDDNGGPVNGFEGGTAVDNVLDNDELNGGPVDPADITLTEVSTEDPGITLDPLTGEVNVAAGTPAGIYELVYQICENLNPGNCDQATVTVIVSAPEIIANDDNGGPVNGYEGGTAVDNVLDNDELNGSPVDPANITLTQLSTEDPGITLDPLTGEVNVDPGTPAGTYELVYEICEIVNPDNCDDAVVTVTVEAAEIVANDDTGDPVNGFTGGISYDDVLVNDLLNGDPVNPGDIVLFQVNTTNPGIMLEPATGEVWVAPGTPAGNYELVYQICEILNPTNCDQATVTVEVTAADIVANDDNGGPVNGYDGGTAVADVLVNDLLNGDPVDPADITLTEISSENPGVTLDPLTGAVNVAPGTPEGTYELVYEICEILNPDNCDQATVTVEVAAPEIVANDDFGASVNGFEGGVALDDVLTNDELNSAPVNPAEVNLSQISTTHPGVSLNTATGEVLVGAGTPAGNYELVYEICEVLNPSNCDQATVFVEVLYSTIVANDDTGITINGYTGGTSVADVLVNDELNGLPVDPVDVTLSQISTTMASVNLDPLTGEVNVAPGTPAGNYEVVYEICEILNPTNCDQATVTVPVSAPEIIANDDAGNSINGFTGGTSLPDVLANDLLNGDPVNATEITLTQISSGNPGISLNETTGEVTVEPGTPAGNYELVYEICEIVNPANCDQATVTVPVTAPEIVANDDNGGPVNGFEGGTGVNNVLDNDLLNGDPVDPADVTLTQISTEDPGITLDPGTGAVNVAPGTPSGTYELVYEICEVINPSNCDQAVVTIEVVAPEIVANDDNGGPVNGFEGGTGVNNVLDNDLLNGDPVDPADVILTQISTEDPGVTLDPLTGAVNVAAGTPAGTYELVYEICEVVNPSNCDQAVVTIDVIAAEIIANDDTGNAVNGAGGGVSLADVLANDLLNGDPVDPAEITLTQISSTDPGVTLNPSTGEVIVASGTAAGNYELVYEICEMLNPDNCDQATVSVPVFVEPLLEFCFNGEPAENGTTQFFCSTENIAFTLCDIYAGEAPFSICWEIDGAPDCELIVNLGDTLFMDVFDPGTYNVKITSIMDNMGTGVSDLSGYDFTFEVVTGPSAFAGPDALICENLNHVLSAATASNYSALSWAGGDGTFVPSANVLNPMYIPGTQDIADGSVNLCLTAVPEDPCTTEFTDCMKLTIQANAVADAGADITVCETAEYVELSGTVQNGIPSWEATIPTGGFFDDPSMASTRYYFSDDDIQLGTIELCLTAIPSAPCFIPETDCLNVTIMQSPEADAGTDKTVCEGESVLLDDASATNASGVLWSTGGDGTFADPAQLNTSYSPGPADIAAGEAQLCLTANPLSGCSGTSVNCLNLDIFKAPSADLGPDRELDCADYDVENGTWLPVNLANTITGDYQAIQWTTSGDGTFDDATAESPDYYPGISDIWDGDVELCINIEAAGECFFNVTQCIHVYLPQQLIYFHKNGWWGISSYLETDLPTVPEVMDPLVLIPGSQHLVNMVDKTGKYFWPEPVPPQSTLGDWLPIGYKLKLKNTPACLPIYGDSLADQTFEITGSFSYLPTLTNVPVEVESLFAGHVDDILLIFHWATNELWTPVASDFDSIYPGYAYLMVSKIGSGTYTIEYPDYVPDAPHLYPNQVPVKDGQVNNSPWADVENTALPHIFMFSDQALSSLKPGDILGAFDGSGNCFGMAEFSNSEAIYKLVAMGNDGITDGSRGFYNGDEMNFRIFNKTSGEESEVEFIFDENYPSYDGRFSPNSVSMVKGIIKSATTIGEISGENYEISLYPNPADDQINVVSNEQIEEISIMNSIGQQVYRSEINGLSATIDVNDLTPGIYMLAVKHKNQKVTVKRVTIR